MNVAVIPRGSYLQVSDVLILLQICKLQDFFKWEHVIAEEQKENETPAAEESSNRKTVGDEDNDDLLVYPSQLVIPITRHTFHIATKPSKTHGLIMVSKRGEKASLPKISMIIMAFDMTYYTLHSITCLCTQITDVWFGFICIFDLILLLLQSTYWKDIVIGKQSNGDEFVKELMQGIQQNL